MKNGEGIRQTHKCKPVIQSLVAIKHPAPSLALKQHRYTSAFDIYHNVSAFSLLYSSELACGYGQLLLLLHLMMALRMADL